MYFPTTIPITFTITITIITITIPVITIVIVTFIVIFYHILQLWHVHLNLVKYIHTCI